MEWRRLTIDILAAVQSENLARMLRLKINPVSDFNHGLYRGSISVNMAFIGSFMFIALLIHVDNRRSARLLSAN